MSPDELSDLDFVLSPKELKALKVHPLADMLPKMPQAEFSALVDDIEKHGVCTPITLFEEKILDGRHRVRAAIECGKRVEATCLGGDEAGARAFVLSMNLHRRHLSAEQKRALVAAELKADPEQSDRAIAAKTKVSDKTVAKVRKVGESSAEIPQSPERKGRDGRKTAAVKVPLTPDMGKGAAEHARKKREAAKAERAAARLAKMTPEQLAAKAAAEREASENYWRSAVDRLAEAMAAALDDGIDVRADLRGLLAEADERVTPEHTPQPYPYDHHADDEPYDEAESKPRVEWPFPGANTATH